MRPLCIVILVLTIAAPTHASEPAQLLIMHGVAELHSGMTADTENNRLTADSHYRAALALFTQALQADPQDEGAARYFKGISEARLEQWEAAVDDLKQALARNPDLTQARLEIGVALTKQGDHDGEAVPWLRQAQQKPDLDAAASFYLGIAQLRLRDLAGARESLARAARTDPTLASVCRYYQALVEIQDENREPATRLLETVVSEAAPGTGIRTEASKILMGLQRGEWPTGRSYQVYANVGLEYDSNVKLAPLDGDAATGFTHAADGRAVLAAGGTVFLWRATNAQLGASYDFLQSLHFNLNEFDIQSHRPTLFLNGRFGILSAGVVGAYDYYLRDLNSFLQEAEAFPWTSIEEGNWGRFEGFYRFRWRDFKQASLRQALNSFTHTIGTDQYIYLPTPDRYVAGGYRYDHLDPRAGAKGNFMYDAHQVWGGVGWSWPFSIATELDFAYRFKDYRPASHGRNDNEYRLVASARKPLTRRISTTLAYFGTFNDSNQSFFTYNRHIVSLSVGLQF